MQVATRSYQNPYSFNPGGRLYASGGTQLIAKVCFLVAPSPYGDGAALFSG